MPTKQLYRLWCKDSQNWELHNAAATIGDFICQHCGKIHEQVPITNIPQEKLEEQRKRYKAKKLHELRMAFILISTGGGLNTDSVYEDDAGQKAIDEHQRRLQDKRREFIASEKIKFQGAERNSPCRCESEKKYKKCCLQRIESYY